MTTDTPTVRDLMSEREVALGVQPIAETTDEFMTLVRRAADLFGIYGPGGTASDRKKSALADLEHSIRAVAESMDPPQKMTEAAVERAALSHKAFKDLTAQTEKGRAAWFIAEQELQTIHWKVNREQRMMKNPEGI